MGAMRSASEQQLLARDCLSGVDTRDPRQGMESSMECLMTLLWATRVIDRERQKQEKASRREEGGAVRQACMELDELFRIRTVRRRGEILVGDDGNMVDHGHSRAEKSLEDWRFGV